MLRACVMSIAAVLTLAAGQADAQGPAADSENPPADQGLFDVLGHPGRHAKDAEVQEYGWLDMGYSYSSAGTGLLAIAPDPNRFGREFLLNQAALVLAKPLQQDRLSLGFYVQVFAGADAALLQGPGDIQSTNPRFGATFRQLNASVHLPVLTDGGVDVILGRMGTWMGYESYMAPNRPLYSLSYQWNFAEDGADTGLWTVWHLSERCDFRYALTLGSNTFFTLRGDAPCHLGQINYALDKRTQMTSTLLIGNQAIGNVIPYTMGKLDTVVELRLRRTWRERFSEVLQANLGWDQGVPLVGLGEWYGVLAISEIRLTRRLDALLRLEWFDDRNGTRTGLATNYYALTSGVNFRPRPWITLRPELRGDCAGAPAFGSLDSIHRHASQLTAALECLLRF